MKQMTTNFFVECEPTAFQRVRVNTRTGRFYNSKEYTQAKEEIAIIGMQAVKNWAEGDKFEVPNCDPVDLEVTVILPKPNSTGRPGKYKNCVGIKKGDADNFLKTVMDALEGTFYYNDGQIGHAEVWKIYQSAENPVVGLDITVKNYQVKKENN